MTAVRWLWRLSVDVVQQYRADRVGDLAAAITFWVVVSVPAAMLALISALGPLERALGTTVIDDLRSAIDNFVDRTFLNSQPLQEAIDDLFTADQSRVLGITTLFAVFTLSRGFAAIIRALDDVYSVEESRRWWHVRLVAMGLGIGTIAVVATAAATVVIVSARIGSFAALLLAPVTMGVLVVWASMVFHLGPNHRTPWRFDLPGAVATAIGWTLSTQLFALYVRLAPQGNQVQSTVGALLLGITLFYVLAVVMLVGAEVNAVLTARAGVARARSSVREHVDTAKARLDTAQTKVVEIKERLEREPRRKR